ncbi:MAG: Apolipoprotein N-acyltransferase in lipid-linked oligosaccharide synthesis cluster, partial [uncultured Nocardioidaceae bacterium]
EYGAASGCRGRVGARRSRSLRAAGLGSAPGPGCRRALGRRPRHQGSACVRGRPGVRAGLHGRPAALAPGDRRRRVDRPLAPRGGLLRGPGRRADPGGDAAVVAGLGRRLLGRGRAAAFAGALGRLPLGPAGLCDDRHPARARDGHHRHRRDDLRHRTPRHRRRLAAPGRAPQAGDRLDGRGRGARRRRHPGAGRRRPARARGRAQRPAGRRPGQRARRGHGCLLRAPGRARQPRECHPRPRRPGRERGHRTARVRAVARELHRHRPVRRRHRLRRHPGRRRRDGGADPGRRDGRRRGAGRRPQRGHRLAAQRRHGWWRTGGEVRQDPSGAVRRVHPDARPAREALRAARPDPTRHGPRDRARRPRPRRHDRRRRHLLRGGLRRARPRGRGPRGRAARGADQQRDLHGHRPGRAAVRDRPAAGGRDQPVRRRGGHQRRLRHHRSRRVRRGAGRGQGHRGDGAGRPAPHGHHPGRADRPVGRAGARGGRPRRGRRGGGSRRAGPSTHRVRGM